MGDVVRPVPSGPDEPFGPVAYDENGRLRFEGHDLASAADAYGTPLFLYAPRLVREEMGAFQRAFSDFDPIVAYAVKANACLALIQEVAAAGGGADVVSGLELSRSRAAGIPPERIVFAGCGKTDAELEAAVKEGIFSIHVESLGELERLARIAREANRVAPVSVRVNPDVDPQTHAYISTGRSVTKFGLDPGRAMEAYRIIREDPHLDGVGLHIHIGSQITSIEPFREAAARAAKILDEVAKVGVRLTALDIGGGLGIRYRDESPPSPADVAKVFAPLLAERGLRVVLEPGRRIVGNAGVLLTRVIEVKETGDVRSRDGTTFCVVDAAMNDLLRPALYQAYHSILPVRRAHGVPVRTYDVVGPVCETGDFLALNRRLPEVRRGDLLAVLSAGAYAMAMASNYNLRPRAAEVLVENGEVRLARRRETEEDLIRLEVR